MAFAENARLSPPSMTLHLPPSVAMAREGEEEEQEEAIPQWLRLPVVISAFEANPLQI